MGWGQQELRLQRFVSYSRRNDLQPGASPFWLDKPLEPEYFSTELDNSWSPCVSRDDRTTVLIVDSQKRRGEAATEAKVLPSYEEARAAAWILTGELIKTLDEGDANQWPGTHAWLEDFRQQTKGVGKEVPLAKWPKVDAGALVDHNPNFWRMYYEIAPGDPMLTTIHAGLLLSQGEAMRAAYIIELGKHRPGVPKEFVQAFRMLQNTAMAALKDSNAMTEQGTQMFDRGDYDGALAKYREALVLCPQNGWTSYELGYTLRTQAEVARGEKPGKPGTVKVNGKSFNAPDVTAAFAESRRHDPLQFMAYQGTDPEVIQACLVMAKKVSPAWKALHEEGVTRDEEYHALKDLSEGFQEAGVCDLAILARQLMAARRNSYDPDDYPIIAASLRKLAPGEKIEEILVRLKGKGPLAFRPLAKIEDEEGQPAPGSGLRLVYARQAAAEERRKQTGRSGLHPAGHFRRRYRQANDGRGPGEI